MAVQGHVWYETYKKIRTRMDGAHSKRRNRLILIKSSEFCSFSLLYLPFFLIASRCFVVGGGDIHSPNIFSRRLHWNITLASGSSNHDTPDSRYRCSARLELCFLRDYFTPAVMIQTNAPPCWGAAICCDAGINVTDIRNSLQIHSWASKPLQANRKTPDKDKID